MLKNLLLGSTFALLAFSVPGRAAVITTATSGVYDENVVQPNTVDADSFSTTATNNSVTHIALATFTSDVATAYGANTGGVINFDDVSSTFGVASSISATYGVSQANTLTITGAATGSSTPFQIDMSTGIGATPISGGNYLRNSNSTQTYNFSAPLAELGYTVVARNGARTLTATLTYSDNSTAVYGPYSMPANTGSGATSSPDTFFAYAAPAGKSISSLQITEGAGGYFAVDDIGFVTPEPASLGLLLVGGSLGMLARRRRGACRTHRTDNL